MRLHDDGVLDIDTPISTYVSDWGDRDHDPTLAQLLSNSAGMVGLDDNPVYPAYVCQFLETETLTACGARIYTANDAADLVEPDTMFRYGGAQWQLAGAVAEQVSGKSWDTLIDETYRQPCGLTTLGYSNHYRQGLLAGGDIEDALAYPAFFSGDISTLPTTENPNIEGGGYTDIASFGAILLMHLRGGECPNGRVLSEASVARMQQDRVAEWGSTEPLIRDLDGYGLSWWMRRDEPGVVVNAGAFGSPIWLDLNRGYGAMIIVESRLRTGVALNEEMRPLLNAAIDAATP